MAKKKHKKNKNEKNVKKRSCAVKDATLLHWEGGKSTGLKVSGQCPLVLLVHIAWKLGRVLGFVKYTVCLLSKEQTTQVLYFKNNMKPKYI